MKPRSPREPVPRSFRWRARLLFALLFGGALTLAWRAVNLQLVDHGLRHDQRWMLHCKNFHRPVDVLKLKHTHRNRLDLRMIRNFIAHFVGHQYSSGHAE